MILDKGVRRKVFVRLVIRMTTIRTTLNKTKVGLWLTPGTYLPYAVDLTERGAKIAGHLAVST